MEDNQLKKEKWLLASTFLNFVMAIGKLAVGIFTNTSVIVADGIHSLSDVVGALLIYASVKLAGKKSEKFPFGMHKLEDFAALAGGLAIIYAGYEIVKSVVFSNNQVKINHLFVGVVFLFVVLITQVAFAYFEMKSSKKLNSPGVNTDLLNWISDVGTTIVAILGIVLSAYGVAYAQKIAVIIIVLVILKEAYNIIKDAVLTLLDASVDTSILKKAENIIKSHPEVDNIETLFIRKAGSIFIADIVLQIKAKKMETAHDIVEQIERKLKESIGHLEIVTIHYEPAEKKNEKIARFLTKEGLIAERLRDVAFVEVEERDENGNPINCFRYENPYFEQGRGHSVRLLAWLIKQNINEVIFHPLRMDEEKLELFDNLDIKIRDK